MLTKPQRIEDEELLARRRIEACWVCGRASRADLRNQASHIKTRGSGGDDLEWNVISKCARCHSEWGTVGAVTFIKRHPAFGSRIYALGWYVVNGKLWNDKLAKA
jgi:hypothetical protein